MLNADSGSAEMEDLGSYDPNKFFPGEPMLLVQSFFEEQAPRENQIPASTTVSMVQDQQQMRNIRTRNMVELKCHHPEDGPSGEPRDPLCPGEKDPSGLVF